MTHFENEMSNLKEKLLLMASLASAAVTRAIKALVDRDDDLARAVIEEDTAIDRLEMEIDEIAIALLSKAPLASDLRLITVAMKISQDLEWVGDEATTREPLAVAYVSVRRPPKSLASSTRPRPRSRAMIA